ncbi:hypothetical protein [Paenibacillus protaetiae]|uniref:hypothetical protein n=1 Tax=Paenibacillus protaetiae TaxID=2509456 RepID=UPI0013ECC960|nr:hypothetical protein [Paenibacillus protaetiae]
MAIHRFIQKTLPLFMFMLLISYQPAALAAAPGADSPGTAQQPDSSGDDVHQLLEQSLSITEIDKEIDRIRQQQQTLAADMETTSAELKKQEQLMKQKQEQASKVIRAYYMGERDILYTALLRAGSLQKLLNIWDYVQMIFTSDKHALNAYKEQYAKLQEGYLKQEEKQTELDRIQSNLSKQRERVLALQSQVDEQLSSRPDAEQLKMMIEQLNSFWETAGLHEVEQYFDALDKAMRKLPDFIEGNKKYLEMNGFNYTLRLPDTDLNAFLRQQDDRFQHFQFQFKDGKIIASGEKDDISVSITGHYSIINDPDNELLFHVDELLFNGFALPDTTRAELENKFDLGFYPGSIASFIKATDVETANGELIVKLSLRL